MPVLPNEWHRFKLPGALGIVVLEFVAILIIVFSQDEVEVIGPPCPSSFGFFRLHEEENCIFEICGDSVQSLSANLSCGGYMHMSGDDLLLLEAWLAECFINSSQPCVQEASPDKLFTHCTDDRSSISPLIKLCIDSGQNVLSGILIGDISYLGLRSMRKLQKVLELFVVTFVK